MNDTRTSRNAMNPGRRSFLWLAASGLVVPLGAMAPASWRPGPSSPPDTIAHTPICRAAANVTAVAPGSVPRELKIT
jgi:hypothetical protein